MKRFLVAIAGGSGSGKSTLADGIMDDYSDQVEVIHFDDWMKTKDKVPLLHEMHNWDHPDTIDWPKLIFDLNQLLLGREVKIMTKSRRHNPDFEKNGKLRKEYRLQSKRILILEGFMALYNEEVRKLADYKIYLQCPAVLLPQRRQKVVFPENSRYNELILAPMHLQYVEPTKTYADLVIDVENKTADQVREIVKTNLRTKHIL